MRVYVLNILHFSFNRDSLLKILLCIVWASTLIGYSTGIINRIPIVGDFTEYAQASLIVILILLAIPAIVNKLCLADYLFFFFCVFNYISTFILYPDNSPFLKENAFLCLCCVFPYYFIGRLTDIDQIFNIFVLLSTVCILMDLFYFLVYAPGNKDMNEVASADNMYRAYQSLTHVMMLLWATLTKFNIWKLAMTFFGTLFLLSCGTRGPLVCLGFFGIIYFFFFMKFKGAIYVKGIIVAIGFLFVAYMKEIALFLAETFFNLKLSTRIIEKFIAGDLGNDTYRSVLREKLYSVLDSGEHFFGLGVFGCQNYGVIYPHYLPLDIMCTYGYFLGYIILTLLFTFICWTTYITRGKLSQQFIFFLISISIIKLMFTGTFINEPYFFMLLGFCAKEALFVNIKT